MAWRMALLGSNMASLGHTSDETHKGGSKGPFLPELAPLHGFALGWLYTPRRRPSAAVDRVAAFG